jgi:hypothetical protein
MQKLPLGIVRGRAAVDLCCGCGGVFLEFFDGEPAMLSRHIEPHVQPPRGVRRGRSRLTCPDCHRGMVLRPYLDDGPTVARCHRCMATFATRAQLRALSTFQVLQDVESWGERAAASLRRWSTSWRRRWTRAFQATP